MITTEGRNHIRRYLAGWAPAIAQSISIGIGDAAESASDISLQLEVINSPIHLTAYDFVSNQLVFKASIPDDYEGEIYEVGVYSLESDPAAGEFASRNLSTFDSSTEDWVDTSDESVANYGSTATRIGEDSMRMTPIASTTKTNALRDIELDLGGYSAADAFKFAYNVGNSFTSNITFRFMTDASNYYDFSLGSQTAGYKIVSVLKGAAAVTGSPSWGSISQIQVRVSSTSGGASAVEFDAMRIEDMDSASLDYILVSRKVLSSPVTKVAGQAQDIEFYLDVSI